MTSLEANDDAIDASQPVHPPPRTNTRGEQLWTMVDLRGEIDRFAAMLTVEDKKHATIAAYVTQAERFLNWLEGTYRPRSPRLGRPYGWCVSDESRTKYRPLLEHLRNHPGNSVTLTFRNAPSGMFARALPRNSARRTVRRRD